MNKITCFNYDYTCMNTIFIIQFKSNPDDVVHHGLYKLICLLKLKHTH